MNIIKKIISFFENIFKKDKEVKVLENVETINFREKQITFIESLKLDTKNKRKNKKIKVETLICQGDGLGIKNDISS